MARTIRSVYRPKSAWSYLVPVGVVAALLGVVLILVGLRAFGDIAGSALPTYLGLGLVASGVAFGALGATQDRARR